MLLLNDMKEEDYWLVFIALEVSCAILHFSV